MPTGWGYYLQGSDQQIEIDELGAKLSLTLHCAVHYPAWGKPTYECKCGVLFPLFAVQACESLGDWSVILKEHQVGYKPPDGDWIDSNTRKSHQ